MHKKMYDSRLSDKIRYNETYYTYNFVCKRQEKVSISLNNIYIYMPTCIARYIYLHLEKPSCPIQLPRQSLNIYYLRIV